MYLAIAIMPYHMFSHLYECLTCHWWAVWERYGDAEYSPDFHVLLESQNTDDQAPLDKPWKQALEDENAFQNEMPLPQSLEQVLIGGKKRILDLPKPGDKVRLLGDVHMLRDFEAVFNGDISLVPLFIGDSEGIVVDNEELYALIKSQHANRRDAKYYLDRLQASLDASNCCPIRLQRLVGPHGRGHRNSCKEGMIYFIDAADIQKMD